LGGNSVYPISENVNYKIIRAEEGSKNIKVEQVRDLLEKIYLKTDKRVVCIQDAEKLNVSSSNSLLKIIEEPPLGTKFIFTTSKLSSIIPTILSRSTILKCNNPRPDDINNYLSYLDEIDIDNYYVLSNLNNQYVDSKFYQEKFSLINDFFYDLEDVISSSENIINFSKKFSVYKIEHIINMLLFIIINFQKSNVLENNSKFYSNNNNIIKDYNSKKLDFIYDKLINIKKNIDIIQNNETILFSICVLFKKLSKVS
jgi:DNA polymerase III gamma/tau subunit